MGWYRRLRSTLVGSKVSADFDEEARFHLDQRIDEYVRSGMAPEEARRKASRQLGSVSLAREQTRDVDTLRWLSDLSQDVRYAVRTLRKSPGFTVVAVATLALGIGANTAIFSVVSGVLLKPLPYANADRIVGIWEVRPTGERSSMTTLDYLDYANQSTVFEHIAATTGCCGSVTLSRVGSPVEIDPFHVSSSYFDVLGAKPALGRTFRAGEDLPGSDHVVVLSHGLWSSEFGADPTVIGRSIRLDGQPYTVIGVMPADGPFDRGWPYPQLWLPQSFGPKLMNRDDHWLISPSGGALALLKPGVSVQQARAELDAIAARIAADYSTTHSGWRVTVDPYAALVVGQELQESIYLLLAAVGMVLLICCVNLANMLLARALAREREVAIRVALGAARTRVIQQFLTESLLLSLSGGVVGVGVGYLSTAFLKTALLNQPPNPMATFVVPSEAVISVNMDVLLFTLIISVLAGITFGLVPAVSTTSGVASGPMGLHRTASARGVPQRLRSALIVTEVALAFVLLTGATLLMRSLFEMQQANTGLDATNVLTAGLPIGENRFPDQVALTQYLRRVTDAVGTVPGVRDVALSSGLPFQGVPSGVFFQIGGRPPVDRARQPLGRLKVVSPSYFRTLRLTLRAGRTLTENDRRGSPFVTVVNETMARLHFPGENPVGQHILMDRDVPGGEQVPWEVVGLVADERLTPFADKRESAVLYVTYDQSPSSFVQLLVRGALDPLRLENTIRQAVARVDGDQALTYVKTVEQVKEESMAPDRLRSWLLGVFAAMALLLSAIGIYGVISYFVVQRTREIGIRAALGASTGNLLGLILRSGMTLTFVGLVFGFVSAFGVTRLLRAFLFGVGPFDPITIGVTAAVLASVAALACYLPARNATRVDPMVVLRAE